MPKDMKGTDARLISRAELCRRLGRDGRTIDRWERSGDLPQARLIGKRRYWLWSEVAARLGLEHSSLPDDEDGSGEGGGDV
jgi:predicted DNA-binding transcriptional regulator AlpA